MSVTIKAASANLNENKIKLARGPYVIIATVVWEFFSYFGMCSLLILYLTQALHRSDQYSYSLYGAYAFLTYLTPVIGGWIADNYLGNRYSIILGAVLIMCGHFTLALSTAWSLYLGLSLLICGVGFFKSSAICLIGEYYSDSAARNSAFMFYYMGGNIGAALAPIVCGYIAAKFGWEYGFAAAGVGMFCGLIILLVFRQYLTGMGNPRISLYTSSGKLKIKLLSVYAVLLIILLAITNLVIIKLWGGYVLIGTIIVALLISGKLYLASDAKVRSGLRLGLILTLFGVLYWIFCQQGGSSISLFIERFVNRNISWANYTVPTAMFQAINPASIVIFGLTIAYSLKKMLLNKIAANSMLQVTLGIVLLTMGFMIIAFGAAKAELIKISMLWVIIGLTLVSVAEIFIDPIILGVINKVVPAHALSTFIAIYYLFVGAVANYLAAEVAKFTAAPTAAASVVLYKNTYQGIVYIGIAMIMGLIVLQLIRRGKKF